MLATSPPPSLWTSPPGILLTWRICYICSNLPVTPPPPGLSLFQKPTTVQLLAQFLILLQTFTAKPLQLLRDQILVGRLRLRIKTIINYRHLVDAEVSAYINRFWYVFLI